MYSASRQDDRVLICCATNTHSPAVWIMWLIILCSCSKRFVFLLFLQDDYVRTWDENQGSNDSKSPASPHRFLIVWFVKGVSHLHAFIPFFGVIVLIYHKETSKMRPGREKFAMSHLWKSLSRSVSPPAPCPEEVHQALQPIWYGWYDLIGYFKQRNYNAMLQAQGF